jgi:carboxyl-terminal processing protease
MLLIWCIIWYSFHNFLSFPQSDIQQIGILQTQKIQEAYGYLEKKYYWFHERTQEQREDALIDALTKSLWDKHTSYFNTKEAKEFSQSLSGDFEGIGAIIQEHREGIQIMKTLKDSPASRNNLQKWDIIRTIDWVSTVGMTTENAVEHIRWPKWTTVSLWISSWWIEKNMQIQRDMVLIPSVDSLVLTWTTIWYIEIAFFGEHSKSEFSNALNKLVDMWVSSIIIDARNNWWWYLDAAVDILSFFLPTDMRVVSTRWIDPRENIVYKTQRLNIQNLDIPIIMLVNNASASATEIMAWALQDYDRALIIGEKTYGKWSVQEPFHLSDGSMLKITIAKWFTPKDRWIDEKWIEPDMVIKFIEDDYKNIYDRQLEWAKILMQYILKNKTSVLDIKKNSDTITTLLQKNNILQ